VDDDDPAFLVLPHAAAPADDESVACRHGGWEVLVCRSLGQFFAVENRCTHRAQKLEGGRIRRGAIYCPFHGARFALASGAAIGPPATDAIRTFTCRETADGVVVELPPVGGSGGEVVG